MFSGYDYGLLVRPAVDAEVECARRQHGLQANVGLSPFDTHIRCAMYLICLSLIPLDELVNFSNNSGGSV